MAITTETITASTNTDLHLLLHSTALTTERTKALANTDFTGQTENTIAAQPPTNISRIINKGANKDSTTDHATEVHVEDIDNDIPNTSEDIGSQNGREDQEAANTLTKETSTQSNESVSPITHETAKKKQPYILIKTNR